MIRKWMGRVLGRLGVWRRRGERSEALAERLRGVEERLEELEAEIKTSKGEEMSEVAGGGGKAGGWPLQEELAGAQSGSAIAALAGETLAPRETGEAGAGETPAPREEEMLEKARGAAGMTTEAGVSSDEQMADEVSVDVRRGMPQGIPGQQTRRKAARLWEGVL